MTQYLPPQRTLTSAGSAPVRLEPATPGAAVYSANSPRRYFDVVFRYKWLILLVTALGTALGALWTRRMVPRYEVHATIWLSSDTPQGRNAGPIRPEHLLNATSWPELLGSFAILDSVAQKERLYVQPERKTPTALFATFDIDPRFRPGSYVLQIDPTGRTYTLLDDRRQVLERGTVGDSIGRRIGFRWAPASDVLRTQPTLRFTITTPRDAAIALRARLGINLPRESSMLRLSLDGTDPVQVTETMNMVLSQFVSTASRLRTRNLVEFANALEQQLNYAAQEMRTAEIALEDFRVRTITLPSEGGGSIAAGLEMTRDPVMRHFFDQKLQLDSVRSDRESLERTLMSMKQGELEPSALWSVPAVHGMKELTDALTQLATQQSALRSALQFYTDQHKSVVDLRAHVAQLEQQTVPALASILLDNIRRRERDLQDRVDGSSRELKQIPTRTIEEMRLRRNVDARQSLYTTLKSRYEEAQLGEASALPDLSVLDYPVQPRLPMQNTGSRMIALALLVSFGGALVLALLLDRLDRRFMYPEQATHELGLDIVGVVPRIKPARAERARAEQAWQVTESFRTIRLGVMPWQEQGSPLRLAITSPGSGDGKSLVAANLACSFADAGFRTLLIDGDVRRGTLHATFALSPQPGLTDYLAGNAELQEVLRPTGIGLTVISAGSRGPRAPELLASNTMTELLAQLGRKYDIILVDSAPLNAGVDAFVVGTLATNVLLVLRAGITDRKLAEAKLRMVDRLPIRIIGAVLNGVRTTGAYRYYSYRYDEAPSSSGLARIPAPLVG
jgi:succinoglycan biosynthesis transport protein ExoP